MEAEKQKQHARLEDWEIDGNDLLVGYVYGHPMFADGEFIRTSRVVSFNRKTGKAVTLNTNYELGKPARGSE